MISFGVIISTTSFRNRGNTSKGSAPPYVSRSRSRRRRTGVRKAKELHLDWGKQDKGVTTYSRHCLLSNWEPRSDAFSTAATSNPMDDWYSMSRWVFQTALAQVLYTMSGWVWVTALAHVLYSKSGWVYQTALAQVLCSKSCWVYQTALARCFIVWVAEYIRQH